MSDLQVFYEQLQSDVIAEARGSSTNDTVGEDFKENAFTRILIEDLALAGELESPEDCYYKATIGGAELKINAYSIPDEDTRIDLVIADYHSTPEPKRLTMVDVDHSIKMALRFFKATIDGRHLAIEPGSDAFAMMKAIHSRKDKIDRIQIFLSTNGLIVQRKERTRSETFGNYKIRYDTWDIERLRRFRSKGASYEPIDVDLSGYDGGGIACIPVPDSSLGYSSCLSMIPGSLLYEWYDEYGSRLLELNVRSYLQARGKINKGILETLVKEPHYFLAYNNGITIVAEEIKFNQGRDRITSIRGLQIVNGGQTTASIHRARKDNQADLSHVYVQAKLTVVPPEEFEVMVPEISRFSNTQNRVSEVDLRANHSFHVGLERAAKREWVPGEQSMWFYERARGSYQTERSKRTTSERAKFDKVFPTRQRFSKEDIARYSNIWEGLPHIVSKGGQKNFTKFMESVPNHPKDWEPTSEEFKALIAKAILFRGAQQLAKELEIPAFRINIVNYTVALLAEKTAKRINLLSIWDKQDLLEPLKYQIKTWLPKVANALISSAGDRNPTEWFKMENCWKHLRESAAQWELSSTVVEQLNMTGGTDRPTHHPAHDDIARCMQIDAIKWGLVVKWGVVSGQLREWQIGLAGSLRTLAEQRWIRKPTERQAKQGVRIFKVYEEHDSGSSSNKPPP